MKKLALVYDEKSKKLEYKEKDLGWKEILNPLAPYKEMWELTKFLIDRFRLPGTLSQDDSDNIKQILEEGRKQKVDEMEIEMNRDTAAGLSVNGIEGADITFGVKGKTGYVMKVKYKYDT